MISPEVEKKIYVKEAIYDMPYNELYEILKFFEKQKEQNIPQKIKEKIPQWKEFIIDNF